MFKAIERAVLARILPKASASAFCLPQQYCEHCGGIAYKRICIMADCSWTSTGCNIPCPSSCA